MTFFTFWALMTVLTGFASLVLCEAGRKEFIRKGFEPSQYQCEMKLGRVPSILLPIFTCTCTVLAAYSGAQGWNNVTVDHLNCSLIPLTPLLCSLGVMWVAKTAAPVKHGGSEETP